MSERSFLEIRRLAGHAHRSEDALAVLQDALLETVPEGFERAIAQANELSARRREPWAVWFFPHRLDSVARRHGTTDRAFEAHPADFDKDIIFRYVLRYSPSEIRRAIVVYRTPTGRAAARYDR